MTSSLETKVHYSNVDFHNVISFYSQKMTIVIFELFVCIYRERYVALALPEYFFLICAQHMLKCFNLVTGNLSCFFSFFF